MKTTIVNRLINCISPVFQKQLSDNGHIHMIVGGSFNGIGDVCRRLTCIENSLLLLDIPIKLRFDKRHYNFFKDYCDEKNYSFSLCKTRTRKEIQEETNMVGMYALRYDFKPLIKTNQMAKDNILIVHSKKKLGNRSHRCFSIGSFSEILHDVFESDFDEHHSIHNDYDYGNKVKLFPSATFSSLLGFCAKSKFVFCELSLMQHVCNSLHIPYFIISGEHPANLKHEATDTYNIRSQHVCLYDGDKEECDLDKHFSENKEAIIGYIRKIYDQQKKRIKEMDSMPSGFAFNDDNEIVKELRGAELLASHTRDDNFTFRILKELKSDWDISHFLTSYNFCCRFPQEINWLAYKYGRVFINFEDFCVESKHSKNKDRGYLFRITYNRNSPHEYINVNHRK